MQTEQQKLYHLHLGDVFLPPNRSFDILVDCADQIVAVHDRMHQTIEHTDHRTVSGRQESNAYPNTQHHGTVMVHVQERYVCESFAHHEKHLKTKSEFAIAVRRVRIDRCLLHSELTVSSKSNILSKKNRYVAKT